MGQRPAVDEAGRRPLTLEIVLPHRTWSKEPPVRLAETPAIARSAERCDQLKSDLGRRTLKGGDAGCWRRFSISLASC